MVRTRGLNDRMDRLGCRDCEGEKNNTKQRDKTKKRARMQYASERMKGRRDRNRNEG